MNSVRKKAPGFAAGVRSPLPSEPLPSERVMLGTVLGLTVLVYAATLRFEFVYDDQTQILRNTMVHSWRFVPRYFKGGEWQDLFRFAAANYYRPFNFLWFRVNDAVFGLRPMGWHATAVLLHILVTVLAYGVARRLTRRSLVAALTALTFAVHPMKHEVVAWVSGTTESLWSAFFFASFLAYLKSRDGRRALWMAISALLFAGALLSKETAIVLPAVVFAHAWIYGSRTEEDAPESIWKRIRKAAALAMLYAPVTAAYLAVRLRVLHGFSHPQVSVPLRTVLFTAPSVAFFYLRHWLLPVQTSEAYSLSTWPAFNFLHVGGPILELVLLCALLWLFRNKLGQREVIFGAIWMIAPLLPVLDIAVLPQGDLVHDRYFYLPSFGASLILALALEKLAHGAPVFGYPRRLVLTTVVLTGLLAYGTANAASYWRDQYSLFEHAYRVAPNDVFVRVNYAIELGRRGDYEKAFPMLQQVLKEQPNNWLANYNLGRICYEVGLLPMSEMYLERTAQLNPDIPETYLQLGLIDMKTNRLVLAEGNMRKALARRPEEPTFLFALGVTLKQENNCDEARKKFAQALSLEPGFPHAQEQLDKCSGTATGKPAGAGVGPGLASAAAGSR
jgi:protein O-mannosyl-transferase